MDIVAGFTCGLTAKQNLLTNIVLLVAIVVFAAFGWAMTRYVKNKVLSVLAIVLGGIVIAALTLFAALIANCS